MAENNTLWRFMPSDTAVTVAAKPKKCSFLPAAEGTLRLRTEGGAPEGKLLLMATCETRVAHWYQEASRDGEDIVVSMAGFDAAFSAQGEANWTLELGKVTDSHIKSWSLYADNLRQYYKKTEAYFADERAHYAQPALSFQHEGTLWEVVPNWANRDGLLSLRIAPRSERYLHQLTCRLSSAAVQDGALHGTILMPEGAAAPEHISLCAVHTGTLIQQRFPLREGAFVIPLDALSACEGIYLLTCVTQDENNAPLRLSPRILDAGTAAALLNPNRYIPAAQYGNTGLYLSMTEDLQLQLQFSEALPGWQEGAFSSLECFFAAKPTPANRCFCTVLGGENWQWKLRLDGLNLSDADECAVVLHRWRTHKDYPCPTVLDCSGEQDTILTVDLTALQTLPENCLRDDFHASLAFSSRGRVWYMPLFDTAHTFYGKEYIPTTFNDLSDFFSEESIGEMPFAGQTIEAVPYWERSGRASIMLADQLLRCYPAHTCRAEKASVRFGRLHMRIQCPKLPGKWVGLAVVHRYRLEVDRKDYLLPLHSVQKGKKHDTVTIDASLAHMEFAPVYWDLRMVLERDGKQFWISIKAPALRKRSAKEAIQDTVYSLFFSDSMKPDKDNQLFLYRTTGNRFALVFQEQSKYSGFAFRLKERLAMLIYYLNRKKLHAQNIMLTYEKYCCMAQDNGFYFFQYCMENNIEEQLKHKIYYIITPDSVDYANVKPYEDHIIPFMSLKHMVYLLACRLMVSSDSKPHAYAWRCKESIIQPRVERFKRLVFLQHGVIALKKVEFFDAATNAVSLFVTSNQREHGIIVRELGYRPEDVIITGLTRWDVLHDRSSEVKGNHILVMPTWRNWLEDASDEVFRQSDYYRNYMELINSERLAQWLEHNDAYLDFYIHPKFRDYLSNFSISGERVRLIPFGSEPLNYLIMQCKMLITDYSSVCWDVYYQGKPCIFYQFDVEQYNEAQGAYIDLEKEMFGERAINNEELFALMEEEAAMDFQLKPKYAQMRLTSYEYLDHNNSQRVCEEIRRRNW